MIHRGLKMFTTIVPRVRSARSLAPIRVRSIAGLTSLNSRALCRLKPHAVRLMGKSYWLMLWTIEVLAVP